MSKLRPELRTADPFTPVMSNGTAYLMIYTAVKQQAGLVHGKLENHGEYCAIGSYFQVNIGTSLPTALVDEVAAVNDSVPDLSNRARKLHVAKWLRWRLASLGFPGFKANGQT